VHIHIVFPSLGHAHSPGYTKNVDLYSHHLYDEIDNGKILFAKLLSGVHNDVTKNSFSFNYV
jgi:hypothetical protein